YPRAYALRDIRPGWPEDFRARIEHDMAALPGVEDRWLEVRIDLRDGEVRFWLDDRLVGWKKAADVRATGLTRIALSPGVQLASFETTSWARPPRFEPLRLGAYANARAFWGAASRPTPWVPARP